MTDDFIERKIMRLDNFDYSQAGPYFLTLCVFNKQDLFGSITPQGKLELTPAGEMVKRTWEGLPDFIPGLILDEHIVMPDHFHAIIGFVSPHINGAPRPVNTDTLNLEDWRAPRPAKTDALNLEDWRAPRPAKTDALNLEDWRAPRPATTGAEVDQSTETGTKVLHVSDIVRRFKNQTIREYRRGIEASGWNPYQGKLWQRGFWDRIIRNEQDPQAHRGYIYNNVAKKYLEQTQTDNQPGCPSGSTVAT